MRRSYMQMLRYSMSAVIALTSISAYPLQIRLDQNMYIRTESNQYMRRIGKLTAGSIISIPDENVVTRANGRVDVAATLRRWRQNAEAQHRNFPGVYRYNGSQREAFFPVTVVTAARGSNVPSNTSMYMALEFLNRRGKAFVVSRDTAAYSAPQVQPPQSTAAPSQPPRTQTPAQPQIQPQSQTQTPSQPAAPTEGRSQADCDECRNNTGTQPVPQRTQQDLQQVTSSVQNDSNALPQITYDPLNEQVARTVGFRGQAFTGARNATCSAFIDRSGNVGSFGQIVSREVSNHPNMLSGRTMDRVCPRFSQFSNEQKLHFWVWVFASLADQESSCLENGPANWRSPNPPAVGLFQLEGNPRFQRIRNAMVGGDQCVGNMRTAEGNIRCAVAIMNSTTVANGRNLIESNSYWEPLRARRRGAGHVQALITSYRACR